MSRNLILDTIKNNKPAFVDVLSIGDFANQKSSTIDLKDILENIKVEVEIVDSLEQVKTAIISLKNYENSVLSLLDEMSLKEKEDLTAMPASDLESLDYAFIKGDFAVLENGAIWVTDKNIINRLVPFICKCLVLVIEEKEVVETMHQAYEKVNLLEDGYGVFISGPSKTADIEQSLVIGAHGPIGMKVFIIKTV